MTKLSQLKTTFLEFQFIQAPLSKRPTVRPFPGKTSLSLIGEQLLIRNFNSKSKFVERLFLSAIARWPPASTGAYFRELDTSEPEHFGRNLRRNRLQKKVVQPLATALNGD